MKITKQLQSLMRLLLLSTLLVVTYSCSEINFDMPPGPDGKSAHELWKEQVNNGSIDWPKDKTELVDFFAYLKGKKGEDGKSAYELWKELISKGDAANPHNPNETWNKDRNTEADFWDYLTGRDGVSPHIGDNGNWWIGTTDTQIPAKGKDGVDGKSAYEVWKEKAETGNLDDPKNPGDKWPKEKTDVEHFFQYLTGANGKDGVDGKDGLTPHIGDNGNWWIGTTDTNVPAEGKDGSNGKSAYELWVEDVKKGSIVDSHTGQVWPSTEITQNDFWRYLKGKDGQSAYDIWKEMAQTGTLDDPKNPDEKWPKDQTSETDFWLFLMGKDGKDGKDGVNGVDGQSAYELWVEEVEKGLRNPHDEEGNDWPKDRTTTDDFWKFLSGKDGADGSDGRPGEPGKPGEPVILVKGIPNVIAQYALQEQSEYVRWSDGAVLYIVYNDMGQPSAGAKIKGLPGVADPTKEYVADENGQFLLPKEDLPEGKPISELVGQSASVTYLKSTGETVTEASAKNTYVPNRIHIRLVKRSSYTIDSNDVNVYVRTERNIGTPDAKWETIPNYLGSLTQNIKAYELRDKNDPTSFDRNSTPYYNSNQNIVTPSIYIKRPRIKPDYMLKVDHEWDNKDHYYVIEMKSYYGEDAMLHAVIRNVPIQYGPIITGIESVKHYAEPLNSVASMTVVFDVSKIDPNHIYNNYVLSETKTINGIDYEYWNPVLATNVANQKMFGIEFKYTLPTGLVTANNNQNRASINNSRSDIGNVHVLSTVTINSSDARLLASPSTIGSLKYNKETKMLDFIGTKSSTMVIPDILNIPVEQ